MQGGQHSRFVRPSPTLSFPFYAVVRETVRLGWQSCGATARAELLELFLCLSVGQQAVSFCARKVSQFKITCNYLSLRLCYLADNRIGKQIVALSQFEFNTNCVGIFLDFKTRRTKLVKQFVVKTSVVLQQLVVLEKFVRLR